ncbi:MAG: hypothetical protein WD963_00750 [Candidatus Paceibacterota bacterium]
MKIIKLKKIANTDRGLDSQIESKPLSGGYAVLELLFYIALFSILSLVVINAMITMARSFRETSLQAEFVQSGNIMERISREIRQAYDINSITTSSLKLNIKDNLGAEKTVEFLLSGSNVQILENDVLVGNLNSPNTTVTGLTFTQITTAEGKAVKIFFSVQSSNDTLGRTHNFYNTVVLRGSY